MASEDDDRAAENSNAAGPLDLRYEKKRRRRTAFADVRDYQQAAIVAAHGLTDGDGAMADSVETARGAGDDEYESR